VHAVFNRNEDVRERDECSIIKRGKKVKAYTQNDNETGTTSTGDRRKMMQMDCR